VTFNLKKKGGIMPNKFIAKMDLSIGGKRKLRWKFSIASGFNSMRKRFILLVGSLVLLIPLALPLFAYWEPDVRLTYDADESYTTESGRCIATAGANVHVIFYDHRGGWDNVYYKRSVNWGADWGSDTRLMGGSGYTHKNPSIAVWGDTIHAVWYNYSSGDADISYYRSIDNGNSWDSYSNHSFHHCNWPSIAAFDSMIHLVFQNTVDLHSHIRYRRSIDGGSSWTDTTNLSLLNTNATYPSVAVSGNKVYVLWGQDSIHYRRSVDAGSSWSDDTTFRGGWKPDISVSGNNIHVAYCGDRDGNGEIYYKRSTDGGISWEDDIRLTINDSTSTDPSIATAGDTVYLVWCDTRDGNSEIYYKYSNDNGLSWGFDSRLTNDTCQSLYPSVSVSGGRIHVVWTDRRDGNYEIYYKRTDMDAPSAPIGLTANGSNPSPWTNDSTFIIDWINPPDPSGIAKALCKLGSAPTSDYDTTGSLSPEPPDSVCTTSEGGIMLYVWLEDSAGNVDHNNSSSVNLRYDISPPESVTLLSPSDAEYLNISTVDFIWNESSDALSGIDHYIMQYAFDSSFTQGLVETTTVDTAIMFILSDSIYYWRVKAVDIAGNEALFSDIWKFEVDTSSPQAPILQSPIGGTWLSDTLVTFEWSEVSIFQIDGRHERVVRIKKEKGVPFSPIRYILEIDTIVDFATPITIDTVLTTSTMLSLSEELYYWRVKAYDLAGNEGPYSQIDSFGVDITAPVIESTIVWVDTSYIGPFEITTKVTDFLAGVDSVFLHYKRDEDPLWNKEVMHRSIDWFIDTIPAVSNPDDTVKYYITAIDKAVPGNASADPQGAPFNYYSFIVYNVGVEEFVRKPNKFSFTVNSFAKESVKFRLSIPRRSRVSLKVYDISGRNVSTLVSGDFRVGSFEIRFKPHCSGIYFYKLETAFKKKSGKLIIF
jgi:hypothetical protein